VNPPRQIVPALVFLFAALAFAMAPTAATAQAGIPPTYTDSQAVRGGQWFAARCQSCHPSRDMSSPDFKVRWGGLTALDLYGIISTTMPQNEPGTLSRRAYADIVAYLMQINGLQAGSTPLAADSTALSAARLSFVSTTSSTR
jgi:mono/diheme cytochrome c family protein